MGFIAILIIFNFGAAGFLHTLNLGSFSGVKIPKAGFSDQAVIFGIIQTLIIFGTIGYSAYRAFSASDLRNDAGILDWISAYIIRAAFWAVLIVGLTDATLSFMRVEGFHKVLFGDGAGAVVLELADDAGDWGIRSSVLHSDGAYRDILFVDGGPSSNGAVGHVRMEGKEVFRHAVEKLASVMDEALSAANMQAGDIDWLVPHQANVRIIDAMQKKMNLPSDRVVRTVEQHANTSAASIPLALSAAVDDGRIKNGDVLAMEAIGGGLVWGAALVKFGRPS